MKPLTHVQMPPLHGQFGAERKYDIHTGIDLYAPVGTPVYAIEPGTVVAVEAFTGPHAGLPWWLDTWAVLVEGPSGVILYGEIKPSVLVNDYIEPGEQVGSILRVLRHDKGLPTSMLHLELYASGTRASVRWFKDADKPEQLLDPTPLIRDYV